MADFQARNQIILETLSITTSSVLGSIFSTMARANGEIDPERIHAWATAGQLVGEFASVIARGGEVRKNNESAGRLLERKNMYAERPLRTAQTVVQEKVDAVVKDFRSDPQRIADHISPGAINRLGEAAYRFRSGSINQGQLMSALAKEYGNAVERATIASLQKEGVVSTGKSRNAKGQFKATTDLRFTRGEFEGQEIEITTAQAWARHTMRDYGLEVGYALYEIDYPNLMRFLTGPPR
ncbi:hypothetical protein [Embleya sp. NBC_00896]|uniref:hypothetical protein n=1 Tax=Embleya sp. NBC_00896 TaxID=2975961 RepID=UPI002F90C4CD|nr:hypothetical protein OG928_47670 [Embleya sp. NBC_00896]